MPPITRLSPAAALRGIRVDFDDTRAVDGVDLDVARHALTVVVGPNGSGKSTLIEVLAGARTPSAGTVVVDARARAFVPQRAAVAERLPLTVRDVVVVGAWGRVGAMRRLDREARTAVDDALRRVDMTALHRRPFATLSGGQRQRALLAQGLARGADLLLLDEPTTALDAASAALIRDAIADETARGTAVVCVSHDDRLIAEADVVVRMETGRIIGQEPGRGRRKKSEKPRSPGALAGVGGGE
ncbi:zinc ABC transporter ATP-binding protein AztA [Microbacterium proteolyticum]|uniref:zinc ABC transporter ATP-binding protein AztA n=1 Tax=Microbacterium proteolyticum TaxID=1572644 RepID=UPI0035C156E3